MNTNDDKENKRIFQQNFVRIKLHNCIIEAVKFYNLSSNNLRWKCRGGFSYFEVIYNYESDL